jgi:hypothetical protein
MSERKKEDETKTLWRFLAGSSNQDWDVYAPDVDSVLREYVTLGPTTAELLELAAAIEALVVRHRDDDALERTVCYEICATPPKEGSVREWLYHVAAFLREAARSRSDCPA